MQSAQCLLIECILQFDYFKAYQGIFARHANSDKIYQQQPKKKKKHYLKIEISSDHIATHVNVSGAFLTHAEH